MEALVTNGCIVYFLGVVLVMARSAFRDAPRLTDRDVLMSWMTLLRLFRHDVFGYPWRYRRIPAHRWRTLRHVRNGQQSYNEVEPVQMNPVRLFFSEIEKGGVFESVNDAFYEWFEDLGVEKGVTLRFEQERINRSQPPSVIEGLHDKWMTLGEFQYLVMAEKGPNGLLGDEGRPTVFVRDSSGITRVIVLWKGKGAGKLVAYPLGGCLLWDTHANVIVPVRE